MVFRQRPFTLLQCSMFSELLLYVVFSGHYCSIPMILSLKLEVEIVRIAAGRKTVRIFHKKLQKPSSGMKLAVSWALRYPLKERSAQ